MPSHDLTEFNTLSLGAVASELLRYRSSDQLPVIARHIASGKNVFVLGGGSNVVLAPRLSSLVIKIESTGIRLVDDGGDDWIVEAEAGESWPGFVKHCVRQGWGGLENLALIPGTVGAAPVQNIGAYGVELDQRIHRVIAWNLQDSRLHEFTADQCGFSYRDSMFKQAGAGHWLILKVQFALPKAWAPVLTYPDLRRHERLAKRGPAVTAQDVLDAVCQIRRSKLPDPDVLANAGSFFKNPVISTTAFQRLKCQWPDIVAYAQGGGDWKLAAGWLIEQAGWKGRRLGPVGMHERQALVLVNHGGAKAHDVMSLAQRVCSDVKQRFGVELEQEPVAVF